MCVTCVKYTQLPIDSCWTFCLFFWIYPIITDLFIMWRGGDYPKMKTTKSIHATLMITLVHPERNDFNHVDELWHISIYPKRTPFSSVIKVSYLTWLPLQINAHSLKLNWKRKIVPNHSQQLLFFGSLKILSIGGQGELLRRSSLILPTFGSTIQSFGGSQWGPSPLLTNSLLSSN